MGNQAWHIISKLTLLDLTRSSCLKVKIAEVGKGRKALFEQVEERSLFTSNMQAYYLKF